MKHNFKFIFSLVLLSITVSSFAQPVRIKYRDRLGDSLQLVNTAVKPPRVKRPPALRGELSGGFRLNSNGYSIFVDKGYLRGGEAFGAANRDYFFHTRLIHVELGEIKHSKETKSSPAIPGLPFQPGSYILGKINNFYYFNLGYGKRLLIAGKPDPGTISIHWVYLGGFSAGLLKPYYLQHSRLGDIKYSEDNEPAFIYPGEIIGKSPFSEGFNETKFVPGVFLRTGLHFDFATQKKRVSGLEVGLNGSLYTKKIEQMVRQDNKQVFFNFYLSLQFGKRW